jgi:hypothetical protein
MPLAFSPSFDFPFAADYSIYFAASFSPPCRQPFLSPPLIFTTPAFRRCLRYAFFISPDDDALLSPQADADYHFFAIADCTFRWLPRHSAFIDTLFHFGCHAAFSPRALMMFIFSRHLLPIFGFRHD